MRSIPLSVSLSLLLMLLAGCGKEPRPPEQAAEHPGSPAGQAGTGQNLETTPSSPASSITTTAPSPAETAQKPERKDIIVLTPRAAAKVRDLTKDWKVPSYLRVRVVGGAYKLDLDPDTDPRQDYLGESRGVRVVVDRESSQSLLPGTVVDFIDEGGQRGFKFSAPEGTLGSPDPSVTLEQARRNFKTTVVRREPPGSPPPKPPAGVPSLVHYDSPAGRLAAYLTPDPKDGQKRPAIIWITGGDCNSIDQGCWREGPPQNDQSASPYRKAGIIVLFPSLRGGNDNPGVKEGFFGEVDDVLAAADFLRKQPSVDPGRVYLGGHSTGGTLALLTAECTDRFRAVFSFGPVEDVLGYGPQYIPFALTDPREARLRAPGLWLHSICSPTFVFEGSAGGNTDSLRAMDRKSKDPRVHFLEVKGATHFSLLAPINRLIARKLLRDTGPECNLTFSEEEINQAFGE